MSKPVPVDLIHQLRPAFFHDPALHQHMDPVYLQFIQNAGVMRNDQTGIVSVVEFADAPGHDLHRVHIQAGIRLDRKSVV